MNKRFWITGWVGVFCLLLTVAGRTEKKAAGHRLIAQDKGKVSIVSADGKVEWEYENNFVTHDIVMLKNGNVVVATAPDTLVEVTPEKKIVWQYKATPVAPYSGAVEIHGFQRLDNGLTMFAETGNLRIVEVDKAGKVVKAVPMTVTRPNSHRDARMVRKLHNNHYLICHEGDGMVREYNEQGAVVWSYIVDLDGRERTPGHEGHGTEVFGAVRLPNGNTLIAAGNGNRVIEVDKDGRVVWKVDHNDLPGIELHWVTTLQVLPNGNIIIGNTHAGPDNPQLIEVTHDKQKKVVWTFKNWDVFGNDLCASQVLDVKGKVIR